MMESDIFDFLTGAAYVRGMLRSYSKWLELDADSLVEQFESNYALPPVQSVATMLAREPAQAAPRRPRFHWNVAAAVAAVALLGLSLAGLFAPGRPVASPPVPPRVAASPGTAAPARVAQGGVAGQQAGGQTSLQAVTLDVMIVERRCWVSVQGDGVAVFEGTMNAGETRTFQAASEIKLILGNAGVAHLWLNGRDLGVPSQQGSVWRAVFTPDAGGSRT